MSRKVRDEVTTKIINGFERLSEALKSLLWEKAKAYGLSPIQIQLLLFINNHSSSLCNVSYLAREFNVTKPTISDAVRVLDNKGYLKKESSSADSRSYTLMLSASGKRLLKQLEDYTLPFHKVLDQLDTSQLEQLFSMMTTVIYQLNRHGVLTVQRTCFGCRYYEKVTNRHHCNLLKKNLADTDIRLDCPEYEEKS